MTELLGMPRYSFKDYRETPIDLTVLERRATAPEVRKTRWQLSSTRVLVEGDDDYAQMITRLENLITKIFPNILTVLMTG